MKSLIICVRCYATKHCNIRSCTCMTELHRQSGLDIGVLHAQDEQVALVAARYAQQRPVCAVVRVQECDVQVANSRLWRFHGDQAQDLQHPGTQLVRPCEGQARAEEGSVHFDGAVCWHPACLPLLTLNSLNCTLTLDFDTGMSSADT